MVYMYGGSSVIWVIHISHITHFINSLSGYQLLILHHYTSPEKIFDKLLVKASSLILTIIIIGEVYLVGSVHYLSRWEGNRY